MTVWLCQTCVKIFTLKTPTLIINKDSRQSYRLITKKDARTKVTTSENTWIERRSRIYKPPQCKGLSLYYRHPYTHYLDYREITGNRRHHNVQTPRAPESQGLQCAQTQQDVRPAGTLHCSPSFSSWNTTSFIKISTTTNPARTQCRVLSKKQK